MTDIPPSAAAAIDELARGRMPEAEAGDVEAMVLVCIAYIAKQDWDKAEPWARRLADSGNATGMAYLGLISDARGDEAAAREWERRADESQSRSPIGRAMARFDAVLTERFGGEPTADQLVPAAQAGDEFAIILYGMHLSPTDPDEAVRWLTPKAEAGDRLATIALALVLTERGDDEAAQAWFGRVSEGVEDLLIELFGGLAEIGERSEKREGGP